MISIIIKFVKSSSLYRSVLNLFKKFYAKPEVKYSYEDPEVVSLIVKKTSAFFSKKPEDLPFSERDLRMLAICNLANLKNPAFHPGSVARHLGQMIPHGIDRVALNYI